jgi:hypothetical protein
MPIKTQIIYSIRIYFYKFYRHWIVFSAQGSFACAELENREGRLTFSKHRLLAQHSFLQDPMAFHIWWSSQFISIDILLELNDAFVLLEKFPLKTMLIHWLYPRLKPGRCVQCTVPSFFVSITWPFSWCKIEGARGRIFNPIFCKIIKNWKHPADINSIGRNEEPLSWGVFDMLGKICFVLAMVFLACCVTVLSWFGWMHGVSWSRRRTCSPHQR